jgi:hypothetical protein
MRSAVSLSIVLHFIQSILEVVDEVERHIERIFEGSYAPLEGSQEWG